MRKDIGKEVLERIEKEQVQPYSKWRFIFRRSVMWGLFVLSLILGSLASGVVIFQLTHADWDLYRTFHMGYAAFLLLVLPYFWLVFLFGFAGFAYFYFRKTERGYRYPTAWLISGSILLSLFGGVVAYKVDLAERLEKVFRDNIAFYRMIQERKARIWVAPEKGLLAGEIIEVLGDGKIRLKDFKDHAWQVDVGNTLWRGHLEPFKGLKIKVIGRMEGKNTFVAKEIRPWQGHGWRRFLRRGSGPGSGRCVPGASQGLGGRDFKRRGVNQE
jgi:hypothetical protein